MSGKGGVGKTTLSINIAQVLVNKGNTVGIIDADIHGPNVLKLLGYQGLKMEMRGNKIVPLLITPKFKVASIAGFTEDDSAVIWRGPMKHTAIKQLVLDVDWGELDYLIVDFPPGTGDEHISAAQLIKDVEGVIIISTPQQVSIMDVVRSVDFCKKMNLPIIGLIENMSGGVFGQGTVNELCQKKNLNFLGALPLCAEIVKSGEEGKSFSEYNNKNLNDKFNLIIENILKNIKDDGVKMTVEKRKIAIASDDKIGISNHFGRAKGFMIFHLEDDKIIIEGYRENIGKSDGSCGSCNHSTMIDNIKDCQVVISYGMGQHIYDDLTKNNIKAIVTEEKTVKEALNKFIENNLKNRLDKLH
jgi:ATP-binding protein involved in chromosome partitioning